MRAFLATAEHGSLSAAARHLGLTQPTLGRQINALEAELDLLLFERVGRGLELTQAGREMLRHVRQMGDAADRVALAAMGQSQSIEGEVRITASDILSASILPTVVKQLRSRAPSLHIDIVAANDIRDLTRREADIAVRHVRPEQPDLVTRLIRQAEARFYGTHSYVSQRGAPRSKADLASHDFVSFGNVSETVSYLNAIDIPVTTQNFHVGSDNGLVAWEMVCAGLGICPMYAGFADNDSRVTRLLPQLAPITFPIWLTTHREFHTSPKIRLVFDILADALAA